MKKLLLDTIRARRKANRAMKTAAENVLAKLGGPQYVAGLLGLNSATVYRWTYPREKGGTGGLIPAQYQGELLKIAKAERIKLRPSDFFPD